MGSFLRYAFVEFCKRPVLGLFARTYSQNGEDLIIDKYLHYKKSGFYVDVGASDPDRFNNTKRFYDKNWYGINIEPHADKFRKLQRKRPRDINLNIGIGPEPSQQIFYRFQTDALSTFSQQEAARYRSQGHRLKDAVSVATERLESVLSRYVSGGHVDFLSIDTEGLDLEVLKSNHWGVFLPSVICIESVSYASDGASEKEHHDYGEFLGKFGYRKVHDNGLNSIFVHEKIDIDHTTK